MMPVDRCSSSASRAWPCHSLEDPGRPRPATTLAGSPPSPVRALWRPASPPTPTRSRGHPEHRESVGRARRSRARSSPRPGSAPAPPHRRRRRLRRRRADGHDPAPRQVAQHAARRLLVPAEDRAHPLAVARRHLPREQIDPTTNAQTTWPISARSLGDEQTARRALGPHLDALVARTDLSLAQLPRRCVWLVEAMGGSGAVVKPPENRAPARRPSEFVVCALYRDPSGSGQHEALSRKSGGADPDEGGASRGAGR